MASKGLSGSLRFGALLVLSGCFVISALIRAGEVVAALPTGGDDGFGNPLPSAAQPADAEIQEDLLPDGRAPAEVFAELRRQRDALKAREAEIAAREQRLKTIQQRLEKRLDELRSARDALEETAVRVDDAAGKDVARLAEMYQRMKPKQAGQIFNEMAPSFAAGFIAEMRPDAAALVLANMDADKAYAVSLMLAGRNVNRANKPQAQPAPATGASE